MNIETGNKKKPSLFYGWWIVAAGFVVVGYGIGIINLIVSQLYSFITELGGTVSQSQASIAIFYAIGTISLLGIGPLIDRFGTRKIMIVGIAVAGIAVIGLPYVGSLLYIILGTLAIGMNAGFVLPVQTATANWFMKRRSIALAVVCTASVLGYQIMRHIDISKNSFLGPGVAMLVICIPLALIIRHHPQQYGSLPDGSTPAVKETIQPAIEKDTHLEEINYSLGQALRTRVFWLLTIAMALTTGATSMVSSFRVMYLMEKFDISTTDNILGLAPLMGLVGILLFGFLGDTFPKRYLLAIAVALQSLSVIILITSGETSSFSLYLYLLVLGLGSGTMPLILAIRADYFGRKAFASITVFMGFFGGIISAGFPSLAGWVLDITGSYQTVFLLLMFIGFIAAVMFFFAKPPEAKRHTLAETES